MRNKYKGGEFLSPRKEKILKHLFDYSASTIEQLIRDVFGNCSLSFAYSGMRELSEKGLVEKMSFSKKGYFKGAYVLTAKGLQYLMTNETIDSQGNKVRPSSLAHDVELVDIAFYFKKLKVLKNYYTENQLLGNAEELPKEIRGEMHSLRPDALIEVRRKEESYFFAVEYEASRKFKDGIKDKINRYYDCRTLFGAIFICKDKETLKRFKAVDKKENGDFPAKVYYALLKELKGFTEEIIFLGRAGEKLICE